jgi:hypothetical protein
MGKVPMGWVDRFARHTFLGGGNSTEAQAVVCLCCAGSWKTDRVEAVSQAFGSDRILMVLGQSIKSNLRRRLEWDLEDGFATQDETEGWSVHVLSSVTIIRVVTSVVC